MIYREWTAEDIPNIAALEKECFSDPWNMRMFADAFSSDLFFGVLAEEDGEIVGYALETVLFEDAEIANVAVKFTHRRKGLAGEMMDRLEGEAARRGAERSLLEVRVSNAPAMGLYKKRGYTGVRVRSRYYPDGEDALVMQKCLLGE
ncbi:MAG: ribosomal protein S18-alanine N-acetyltransferase [Clostridia bacterium]|nr:ribosomal protein S18-alanine N-acetyltransferase [Clostridia bacterium]